MIDSSRVNYVFEDYFIVSNERCMSLKRHGVATLSEELLACRNGLWLQSMAVFDAVPKVGHRTTRNAQLVTNLCM